MTVIHTEIVNKHVAQKQQGRLQCTNAVGYFPLTSYFHTPGKVSYSGTQHDTRL